jgi:hypothetical protein
VTVLGVVAAPSSPWWIGEDAISNEPLVIAIALTANSREIFPCITEFFSVFPGTSLGRTRKHNTQWTELTSRISTD